MVFTIDNLLLQLPVYFCLVKMSFCLEKVNFSKIFLWCFWYYGSCKMGRVCAFSHCSNGTYQLDRWKSQICKTHKTRQCVCSCSPPFVLYPFPTERRNKEQRMKWINTVNRHDPMTGKLWMPSPDDRVCSKHFTNNEKSEICPDPVVNLTPESDSGKKSPQNSSPKKSGKAQEDHR